ncbi:MAG TPA: carboxypeptidase-like regulatory domain-containing protein, partial [Polyangia bacterium]|nr:carboxypeptidase-like regulatory domain-containing protein [Polyangia bacterium]
MLTHRLKRPLGPTTLMVFVVGALGMGSCAAVRGLNLDGGAGGNGGASGNGGAGGTTSVTLPDAAASNLDATTIADADNADVEGACQNLACQQTTCTKGRCRQMACPSGQKTTVTGVVFDPAGRVPLYNVAVFVPNAPLKPMTDGVVCGRCQATITNVVTSALTDVKGQFTLDDVPVGTNIPLVVQVGKWRRAVTIPRVTACTNTALPGAELTRL